MKHKKTLGLIVGGALAVNMALMGLAFAETATSDISVVTRSLYFPSITTAEDFSAMNASVQDQTLTKDFATGVQIAGAGSLTSGVEVSVTSTPFYNTTTYAVSFNKTANTNWALAMQTDDNGTITDAGTSTPSCNSLDDITTYTSFADASGGNGGVTDTTDAIKLVDDATTASVNLDCTFQPQMQLNIPAGQAALLYRTTLTFTIADA